MKTFQRSSRNYPVETNTFNIPPGAQKKYIGINGTLSRESWPIGVDYTLSDGHIATNTALVLSFEKTLDDINWLKVASYTMSGGILLKRDGSVLLTAEFQLFFLDGQGNPISDDGDLRAVIKTLVPLRTAIILNMREIGD